MKFKSLTKSDIDLIVSIQDQNFSDGWNREMLLSAFKGEDFFAFGLIDGGQTVGLITYSVSFDSADIQGVVVISEMRQRGYGKFLVDYALSNLKEKGVNKIFLEVRESNKPAIALYSACGFKEISVRKKYYIDGENALVMQKEI